MAFEAHKFVALVGLMYDAFAAWVLCAAGFAVIGCLGLGAAAYVCRPTRARPDADADADDAADTAAERECGVSSALSILGVRGNPAPRRSTAVVCLLAAKDVCILWVVGAFIACRMAHAILWGACLQPRRHGQSMFTAGGLQTAAVRTILCAARVVHYAASAWHTALRLVWGPDSCEGSEQYAALLARTNGLGEEAPVPTSTVAADINGFLQLFMFASAQYRRLRQEMELKEAEIHAGQAGTDAVIRAPTDGASSVGKNRGRRMTPGVRARTRHSTRLRAKAKASVTIQSSDSTALDAPDAAPSCAPEEAASAAKADADAVTPPKFTMAGPPCSDSEGD